MNRLTTKRKDFYTQIRRQQITQKINEIRKTATYDFITLPELAKLFNVNQSSEHESITLIDLLIEKRHLLLEVALGDIEQENTERLPLEAHIRFWKYYSQQLFDQKVKYDPQLGKVLLSIVSKYSYAQVHYSTVYQLHLLNMLQLIAPNLTLKQREKLIDWVAGAQGLRVISACIESNEFEFFKYKFYPNLYKVLQIGLKSELKNESDQAAEILYKILLKADWDDTFQLYEFAQGLMIYLCTKIERYYKDTVIKFYSLSVVLLLDTYDEAVLDYARGAAAYAAALLIISPIQQNYSDGLQILQALTQIDSKKIVTFLLSSKQFRSIGLWSKLCRQTTFPRHLNAKIRQNYLSIFHNLLALGQQPQLEEISDLFSDNYENIFQMFGEVLENQVENDINIRLVLNSLMSFLFYDRVQNEPHRLLKVFETYGLCKRLIYLMESKQGQVSQTCNNILTILGKNGSNI